MVYATLTNDVILKDPYYFGVNITVDGSGTIFWGWYKKSQEIIHRVCKNLHKAHTKISVSICKYDPHNPNTAYPEVTKIQVIENRGKCMFFVPDTYVDKIVTYHVKLLGTSTKIQNLNLLSISDAVWISFVSTYTGYAKITVNGKFYRKVFVNKGYNFLPVSTTPPCTICVEPV